MMGDQGVTEAKEFGAALREERERRGISLDVIAQKTKVSASVLSGLEKGDLSRWPSGIFRRAFLRSYATAVGLDPEATLAEFLRVFPDDVRAKPRTAVAAAQHYSAASTLRLGLAERLHPLHDSRRVCGVAIDATVVLVVLGAGSFAVGIDAGLLAAVTIGVIWHAAGALLWGSSPGLWLMRPRILSARPPVEPVAFSVTQPDEPAEVIRLVPPPVMTGPRGRVIRRRGPVRPEREPRVSR